MKDTPNTPNTGHVPFAKPIKKMTCSIKGCHAEALVRHYCKAHYIQYATGTHMVPDNVIPFPSSPKKLNE